MMGTLTLSHFLSLGAILFALSVIGIFMNRRNLTRFACTRQGMLLGSGIFGLLPEHIRFQAGDVRLAVVLQ